MQTPLMTRWTCSGLCLIGKRRAQHCCGASLGSRHLAYMVLTLPPLKSKLHLLLGYNMTTELVPHMRWVSVCQVKGQFKDEL